MESEGLLMAILLVSILFILLAGFLAFMLFWQRAKSNRFIQERETMKLLFNEQLLRSQLEIQEQSFNTISMEIHDNVGQTLSLLKVQLNIMDQSETFNKTLLTEAKSNAGKAMTDLRDIAKGLSTERIELNSLAEMAQNELNRINNTGVMTCTLHSVGDEKAVKANKKLILFRMIQESFQNIVKHSGADTVGVYFIYADDTLQIQINDNGKGFDERIIQTPAAGLGLQNIVSRAAIIGGSAQINSVANKGTNITITTPYE